MKMNQGNPRVTVLMAVHNGERFLRTAIDSVLAQTFADFELLIINDGSIDRSRQIILAYEDDRIRLVDNEENIGLTKSLNRGLAISRGEFVARLDADDVAHPTRLEKQIRFMDRNPDIALVGTQVRIIDADGNVLHHIAEYRMQSSVGIEWNLLFGNPFAHSSVMFRRQIIWECLGGYDERYQFNQDFELWSRLLVNFRATNIADVLIDYRSHVESVAGLRGAEILESRRRNLRMNKAVQRENINRILKSPQLADHWPNVWCAITVPWLADHPGRPDEVLIYIDRIAKAFARQYTEAKECIEIRQHLAGTLCYVACHLVKHRRFAALKSYAFAMRSHSSEAIRGFPRFAILFLLGESGLQSAKYIRKLFQQVCGQTPRPTNR